MATSFTEIVALAKDRTPAGRRRLATQFSEAYFANQSSFSSDERNLALDIITSLLRDAALEVRSELATVLANEKSVPRHLINALASDVIEVARPVLMHSPVLREQDLLAVIENGSTAHRVAIARRPDLSNLVTSGLVVRHEAEVSLALLDNLAVHIPESALQLVAQQALEQGDVCTALAQRSDLTPEIATRIYCLIGEELRSQIKQRFDLNPAIIDRAMHETISRLTHRQDNPATRRSMAERLLASGTVNGAFMAELLKNRGVDLFRELLAQQTKLKTSALEVLLGSNGSEPLALVCRALGFSKTETASLLMLVRDRVAGEAQFNPAMLADALTTYSRLTEGDAKTVLWQWQSDPGYLLSLAARRSE